MSSRKKKQWRLSHKQPKERLKRPRPTKLHQSQPTKKSKHLYPFQETLLNDVETRLTKSRGILVVSPPGSGKSVMIGALIKKFTDQQKRSLVYGPSERVDCPDRSRVAGTTS